MHITEEGRGQTTVGLSWDDQATDASDYSTWVERAESGRTPGLTSLGWLSALDTYRPMMSYDELGGLLESGPSGLYDALSAALGVEDLTRAVKLLDARAKSLAATGKPLAAQRKELQSTAACLDDERARRAAKLLRAASPDIVALRELATGATAPEAGPLGWLRWVSDLTGPSVEDVDRIAAALEKAGSGLVREGAEELARQRRRVDLRANALELHAELGDMDCPVCNVGHLDPRWAESSREHIAHERTRFAGLARAAEDLERAHSAARSLVSNRPAQLNSSPVEALTERTLAARDAWDRWAKAPTDDLELIAHLRREAPALNDAVEQLRGPAAVEHRTRQDVWTPFATRLATFCEAWGAWLVEKPRSDLMTEAARWLKVNDVALKNERLEPIAEHARRAWSMLRQESNVDLGSVTLVGTATRRRVSIAATVDGTESGALAVMSQGELHALALSLFLPRAALPESPFRFVVLDDPVQAMDPAKVDGLVQLLSELAETRQVIVLSHDDRLPAAARRAQVPVRILEVTRGERSQVWIRESDSPARRHLRDAESLVKDQHLPEETLRRVLPGVLRFAVESAARERFFMKRLKEGAALHAIEDEWESHNLTADRVALAVFDDPKSDLSGWLGRPHRKSTLGIASSGFHDGLHERANLANVVHDAKRLVSDVEQGERT